MKIKRVLKFYFYADSLEKALNGIILRRALLSCAKYGEEVCGELLCIISDKDELSKLYKYVDGVMGKLPARDVGELKCYCSLRTGIRRLPYDRQKSIRRAAVKFKRRARHLSGFKSQLAVLDRYYCLMNAG